ERAPITLTSLSVELKIPPPQLASPLHALCERGIAEKNAKGELELTSTGVAMRDRIVAARRKGLADMLARWRPEEHPDVLALIERRARPLTSDLPARKAGWRLHRFDLLVHILVAPAEAGTHNHRLWNMGPRNGVPATHSASQTRVNALLLSRGAPRGDD